jgi:cobalt-zinc-cadmium efflux system outer membrane protein
MQMHPIGKVTPLLPQIGRFKHPDPAQGPIYTLEDLERQALAHHPSLAQAQANIRAEQGVRTQVGLAPNPVLGYYGDEIRGGSFRSGKQGFFLDQAIVTGGKLGLNRQIEDQAIHEKEALGEAQTYRVRNAARASYYRVLTAQELLFIKRDLAAIAHTAVDYTRQLENTGQADETEVLQIEVAEQQTLIAVAVQENVLHREWVALASAIGEPSLKEGIVQGDLEALPPAADEDSSLASLLTGSPALHYAQAGVLRAEAELRRARRENLPDLSAKAGLAQDNEPLGSPQSRTGLVGFAELGVQLRVFDRNQGAIAAAQASLDRARQELIRVKLELRDRSAGALDQYRNARLIATRYRDEILPRRRQAYVLMTKQYGLMDASFSRMINLQRELYQSEAEYLRALEGAQTAFVTLNGVLYSGGDAVSVTTESCGQICMLPHDLNFPNAQSSLFDSALQPE